MPHNNFKKILTCFCLLLITLGFSFCGGGAPDNKRKPIPGVDDDLAPDFSGGAFEPSNTFSNLESTPTLLDFGSVAQNDDTSKVLSLTNSGTTAINLNLHITAAQGGYKIQNDLGLFGIDTNIIIEPGSSKNINLRFNSSLLGNFFGTLKITSASNPGVLIVPLKATISGPTNIKVISSAFMCANKDAPSLSLLDFKRVASGRHHKMSFKVCNQGSQAFTMNQLAFTAHDEGPLSSIFSENPFEDFAWEISEIINAQFFSYFNPINLTPFETPEEIPYTDPLPPTHNAFSLMSFTKENEPGPITNLIVQPGDYVLFEAKFAPVLNSETPDGARFEPIPYKSRLNIKTNLGTFSVDATGATGGLEPLLKVIASLPDGDVPGCTSNRALDLTSEGAAINFGTASIYEDWIPEDRQKIKLRLCNMGSGTKPLELWADPMLDGYFTFEIDNSLTWPLAIPPLSSKIVTLVYSPTPQDITKPDSSWNLGQLTLRHNAGNGPLSPITLIGDQTKEKILDVFQDGVALKRNYTTEKPKRLLCAATGKETQKGFSIKNNSSKKLISSLNVGGIQLTDPDGQNLNKSAQVSLTQESVLETTPGDESTFKVAFNVPADIPENSLLKGTLTIQNDFENANEAGDASQLDYVIPFELTLNKKGECFGESGAPLDDVAVMVIDRITMIMPPALPDPARNPPSFKFHLPVDLYKTEKRARVHGLPYDPANKTITPIEQIRSYAHQITNVAQCYPLPSNPYKLEFEEGSWDEPQTQCALPTPEDPNIKVTPSATCMENNGTQEYVVTDPALQTALGLSPTNNKIQVYYHEFAKFDANCNPIFEGKISTFFLRSGEKVQEVFDRMYKETKGQGTADVFASYTLPFSFDSYMKFYQTFKGPKGQCNHNAGDKVTDPDELSKCWEDLKTPTFKESAQVPYNSVPTRAYGLIEECSYFQFEIEEGCAPGDENSTDAEVKARCKDVQWNDPKTWVGYGEYEPDPQVENAYNLTLRNVHIRAFTLVHSLNPFFSHAGKLLYSDLYVTLTTKAVGREYKDNDNPYDDNWNSLIAEKTKIDFSKEDVYRNPEDNKSYWTESGVNGQFVVGEKGEFDDVDCHIKTGPFEHCRGNYEFYNNSLIHAGEPINFDQGNRMLVVGLSAFHGKGELAPGFARENAGKGASLFFTFHACLKPTTRDEEGTPVALDPKTGCYGSEPFLDTGVDQDGVLLTEHYKKAGILKDSDLDPENPNAKALINFKIFDEDRIRLTNYYALPSHYKFNGVSFQTDPCGRGN